MKSLIDIVEEKIKKNIPDSNIEIVDNTHLHEHHKSFNKSKTHLKIIIQSDTLRNLNRIVSFISRSTFAENSISRALPVRTFTE